MHRIASEVVRKIFNGYFLFTVKPQHNNKQSNPTTRLSIQNINPNDKLQYIMKTIVASNFEDIDVTVTISNPYISED